MAEANACAFCAIVEGRAPADFVLQDASTVAFLDKRPLFPGHVLVVPRSHHETLVDLPRDEIGPLFANVQRICGALERGLGAEGTLVAVNNRVSQSVPHLHVHVVPRRKGDGLRGFFWPRHPYESDTAAAAVAAKVRAALGP
jgi:histidine triad (HIT) family protein